MRLFYPRHIKSLAYYDAFSPLPFVLRQKRFFIFPLFGLSYCTVRKFGGHISSQTDIRALEGVQRRATKFLLNDYHAVRLPSASKLNTLPLMMLFEINDIVFFIKKPYEYFDISKYVSFCSHHTRSSSHFKLRHSLSKKNSVRNFFSIEYLDFGILFLI